MPQQTIQIIQNNQQHKSFVTPIGDFQLGWNAYVANMPLSECKNRWHKCIDNRYVEIHHNFIVG